MGVRAGVEAGWLVGRSMSGSVGSRGLVGRCVSMSVVRDVLVAVERGLDARREPYFLFLLLLDGQLLHLLLHRVCLVEVTLRLLLLVSATDMRCDAM
jgi:hypothetical protein